MEPRFPLRIMEFDALHTQDVEGIRVTPYPVVHASGAPALAFRIECQGTVVAYSGDTEWTNPLVPAARDADLFIAEAYTYEKHVRFHLDYQTLVSHLNEMRPRRLIVTHMGEDMLSRIKDLNCEYAEDGKIIELEGT